VHLFGLVFECLEEVLVVEVHVLDLWVGGRQLVFGEVVLFVEPVALSEDASALELHEVLG
jgi:hypothetical protein